MDLPMIMWWVDDYGFIYGYMVMIVTVVVNVIFSCDGRWSGMVVMGSLTMNVNLHDVVKLYGGKLDEKIASRLTYEQD